MQRNLSAHEQTEDARHSAAYSITAQYYDSVYSEIGPADIEFYLELAAACGGPVLELGCGTGRVSLPLARAGHQVTALDLSSTMLEVLGGKLAEEAELLERVTLVEASMDSFSLAEKYSLIICPFRAFQHLMDPAAQRACLTLVRRHLAEGGRFVFNAFNPSPQFMVEKMRLGKVWQMDYEGSYGEGLLRRYVMLDYDLERQILDLRMRFEECSSLGETVRTVTERHAMRWLYRLEAEYLLELAGLEIEAGYGAYDRRPPVEGRELIYVCRRSEARPAARELS